MFHRGIATLSGALLFAHFLLAEVDTTFFFLHFYESLIYLAIILMLFYLEERWAYMLGILAPASWIVLSLVSGTLPIAIGRLMRGAEGGTAAAPAVTASLLVARATLLTTVLAILMIIFCALRWKREYSGLGKGWSTFAGSLVVVVVYYGILVYWFRHLFE